MGFRGGATCKADARGSVLADHFAETTIVI